MRSHLDEAGLTWSGLIAGGIAVAVVMLFGWWVVVAGFAMVTEGMR